MLCLTTTECHQRHEMILSVGKLLLRLFYTSQGFVEAFNSGLTYTLHRTATVEDDYIEDLGLLDFVLYFHFIHIL